MIDRGEQTDEKKAKREFELAARQAGEDRCSADTDKKIAIMPERLQRSASQPAGIAPAANAMKPGVASNSSSLYDPSNRPCKLNTAVGKSSMNRWS
ncbi:MAG: hypothetical protein VYE58_04730 [Pseudomonadota bacterium]|nr:hypothetical protein [Pseudomonadota bacterium]